MRQQSFRRKTIGIHLFVVAILISVDAYSARAPRARSTSTSSDESSYIIEPYLAYERGYLTQNGIPEITTSGVGYGARLGVRFLGIGFGLDYFTGSESASQSGATSDFKPTEYGLVISYRFSGMNLYGTYLLNAKAKIQSSDNPSDFSGSGYKIGVGWGLFSSLDINLELYNRTYNKYGDSTLANSLLSSTASLSLSFPIL